MFFTQDAANTIIRVDMSTVQTPIADDEIDLRELILTLLKGWKIIVVSTVLVAVGAFFYARTLPNQYVVSTSAAIVGAGGGNSQMLGLAAMAGINMGGGSSDDIDLMEHVDVVIKKPYFLDSLLATQWVIPQVQTTEEDAQFWTYDTLTLAEYWEVPNPDTTALDWEYRYKMGLYGRLRSSKLNHISVENSSGVLKIKTKFTNPHLSFEIHTILLDLLREYFKEDYSSQGREKRDFVEARLDEVSDSLRAAEGRLVWHQENNVMSMSPRVILKGERLKREVEFQASLYSELITQLELAKLDEKKETPVFEVLQMPERPLRSSEPNRILFVLLGVVFGAALGVCSAFAKEFINSLKA